MKARFRVATTEDIAAIEALIADSVRQLQVEYSSAEREAALATVFTIDSRLVADGTYLLALGEDGQIMGCGGWSRRKTLYGGDNQTQAVDPGLLDPQRDAAKIRAIFVRPEFARQGVGSAILERSEHAAACEGFRQFEMGSTLTGVSLYRRHGYREVDAVMVPVGGGQSIQVVRMVKEPTPVLLADSAKDERFRYFELNDDDLQEQKDKNDGKDETKSAAAVIPKTGAHACAAKAEDQN